MNNLFFILKKLSTGFSLFRILQLVEFRKLNINSFWAEPTFITTEKNHKTSTNFNYLRDFRHIIYSKYVNKRLGL